MQQFRYNLTFSSVFILLQINWRIRVRLTEERKKINQTNRLAFTNAKEGKELKIFKYFLKSLYITPIHTGFSEQSTVVFFSSEQYTIS